MNRKLKIAVVGAGIYGASIAIKLSRNGYHPILFDPLGLIKAASAINQLRVHAGYHYPRSIETINEILSARSSFVKKYGPALVGNIKNYYAIPKSGSKTCPETYESILNSCSLPFKHVKPSWVDFSFIANCYEVQEDIFDPDDLRKLIQQELDELSIPIIREHFDESRKKEFDWSIYATYGSSGSHTKLFNSVKIQVVEKVLTRLPGVLEKKSLVVVDGPFTAFDPYGKSGLSQFGSAKFTTHWETSDASVTMPNKYRYLLNKEFKKCTFSNFELMRVEAMQAVPLAGNAKYLGSRFTIRLVENDAASDRRILRVLKSDDRTIHVFSGKIVSAEKAADEVLVMLKNE